MATQLGDTLTTRDAVRRATLDDILGRAQSVGTTIEGGELDGIVVVSIGKLEEQIIAALLVDLPPATDRYAEVTTPATIVVAARCPECRQPTDIGVKLVPRLTVEGNTTELSVKAKSKPVIHMHGQQPLEAVAGQATVEGAIEDLRLRILRAVDEAVDHWTDDGEGAVPPTLDEIARRLELATESDRFDLQESLTAYAEAGFVLIEPPADGLLTTYALTEAGATLVDSADAGDDEDDDGIPGFMRDEPDAEPGADVDPPADPEAEE